jgi:hypothetical protein
MVGILPKALMLAAATALIATAADAHPRLQTASPGVGATVHRSPTVIRMNFSEGLIARFTGLQLKDAGGRTVPTGSAAISPSGTSLIVPVHRPLNAGIYTVAWHAVSVDTHRVSGHYTFKVAR